MATQSVDFEVVDVGTGDSAPPFDLHHTLIEDTLSTQRADAYCVIRFPNGRVGSDSLLKMVYQDNAVLAAYDSVVYRSGRHVDPY